MEKQEIIQSKLMAKAVIMSGKKFRIVAMFEKSTARNCYFLFTAQRPNDAASAWKLAGDYPAYTISGRVMTFDEFVMNQTKMIFPMAICHIDTKFFTEREAFAEFEDRTINPMKYVKAHIPEGAIFKMRSNRRGYWFSNRDRSFDKLPSRNDVVLVYADFCPECGNKHAIAHWPAGNTKCQGYNELMQNPSLRYAGHRDGQFIFRFRVEYQNAATV